MNESDENDENTPPICVLLPMCIEANTDVLLNILKSVLSHTRFLDNFHIKSMISGVNSETFDVDNEDLSVDWTKLTTDLRQARQSKLLGFWAARHYPLICKKLSGTNWQPPKNCNVRVVGSVEISEAEIDNIVSKKIVLRIVELNVCQNMLKKLKHFVRVPLRIGRVNVTPLSGKIKAFFDIEDKHLPECWQALKFGAFSSNEEQRMNPTEIFEGPQPPIVTLIDQHRKVRRIECDQSTVQKRNSNRIASYVMSPCNVLLTDIISSTESVNIASESTIIPTANRQRCVSVSAGRPSVSTTATMQDETNFDALQVAIFDMRKDIRNLTECLGSNAAEKHNESVERSERFHLAVFQQKDAEISKLKESFHRLEIQNELLKSEKSKLSVENEAKSSLVSALQELVDVNIKLRGKLEEESNVMVQKMADADKLKIVMTETNVKLQEELTTVKSRLAHFDFDFQRETQDLFAANQLNCEVTEKNGIHHSASEESNSQYQLQDLVQKLTSTDELNMKLTEINGKLQEDVNAANNRFASIESNLQCQIQELVHKLSAAQPNIELAETNVRLQEELNSARQHFTNMESTMQCQIQELVHKLSTADRTEIDLTQTNGQLQQELNTARQHYTNMESFLQGQIQELVLKFSTADRSNIELTETNGRLQQELNASKEHFTNMESNLQRQIQELVHKLSTADQTNIELTDTKEKLQQELNAAKIEVTGAKQLNETIHNLKARTSDLINQFRIRIDGIEKTNAQLFGENAVLREKLNILEQNTVENKKLFQSDLPLPHRPETHIQTQQQEMSSEIQNRHDQAELEEDNIQCMGSNFEEKLPEPICQQIDRAPDEDVSIEMYDELKADRDNDLRSETVKSGEVPSGCSLNKNRDLSPVKDFFSNNPVVQECRPLLMQRKFGWMKFQRYKNAKFCPAFVFPPDTDGEERAQKIKADGFLTSTKSLFWEFHFSWELPRDKKQSQEVSGLKKFNTNFGFNFQ